MNTIIDKLSEIDRAASKIIDEANEKKTGMDADNEKRIEAFDKEVEADNAKKIRALNEDFNEKLEIELAAIVSQADTVQHEMEAHYDEVHDRLSSKIVREIIGK